MQLKTAGLLVIKNRKLLLAFSNNKQCYYLPGGKLDEGEDNRQALCREIEEELAVVLQPEELEYYGHITAAAYGEPPGTVMEQDCFFTRLDINPVAAAEIGGLQYFTVNEYKQEPRQAPGAVMILEQLQRDNYID
jgi:8-oxo-dGTP pyrophosphatase MutT (NUDIX family)